MWNSHTLVIDDLQYFNVFHVKARDTNNPLAWRELRVGRYVKVISSIMIRKISAQCLQCTSVKFIQVLGSRSVRLYCTVSFFCVGKVLCFVLAISCCINKKQNKVTSNHSIKVHKGYWSCVNAWTVEDPTAIRDQDSSRSLGRFLQALGRAPGKIPASPWEVPWPLQESAVLTREAEIPHG